MHNMTRQTPIGWRGSVRAAVPAPEDRHQLGLRTPHEYHDLTPSPPPTKEEPDTCPNIPRRELHLNRTLYQGSARPFSNTACPMAYERPNYPSNYRQQPTWDSERIHASQQQSSQQHIFSASSPSNTNAQNSGRRTKRSQPGAKRLVAEDFENLVRVPQQYYETIYEYVGADSRYTLAGTHAGMFIRSCAQSAEVPDKLREVHVALVDILGFFRFVHTIPKEKLKSEQKGCFTLRVCYHALTALLGDFSGNLDISPSEPNAPILARHQLTTFREQYPALRQVLKQLSVEFEQSITTYKHRRSPSPSVVAKLQAILRTLEVWNQALRDDTFTKPTTIIRTWLDNHPAQVDGTRRMRIPSAHSSPSSSELRPSPKHHDSSLFDPYNAGQPHSSPIYGTGIPPNMANPNYLSHAMPYTFGDASNGATYYAAQFDLQGMYSNIHDANLHYQ